MGERFVALVTRPVSRSVSFGAVCGGVAALAILVWFLIMAPAVVAFSLAVASAVAWCMWLERSPQTGVEHPSWECWAVPEVTRAIGRKDESRSS